MAFDAINVRLNEISKHDIIIACVLKATVSACPTYASLSSSGLWAPQDLGRATWDGMSSALRSEF